MLVDSDFWVMLNVEKIGMVLIIHQLPFKGALLNLVLNFDMVTPSVSNSGDSM